MAEPMPNPTPAPAPEPTPTPPTNTEPAPEPTPEPKPTGNNSEGFTPEQQTFIQGQITAAVNAALAQQQKNFQTQIDNARSEGERLAKMNKEERKAEEERIERENFVKEKAEYEHNKLVYETSKILSGMNFSPEFAEFVAKDNAETTKARIDEFAALMNKYKQDITNELMRGTAPVVPGGVTPTKPIEQMTYTEQAAYMAAQGNI